MAGFPGTLSLSVHTFADVVRDLVAAAYRSGFRRIMVFNGNGPHYMLMPHITELMDEFEGLVCALVRVVYGTGDRDCARGDPASRGDACELGENWPGSRPVNDAPPASEPWWEYARNVFLHSAASVRGLSRAEASAATSRYETRRSSR